METSGVKVPTREKLLGEYQRAESLSKMWLAGEALFMLFAIMFLRSELITHNPAEAAIVFCVSFLPTVFSFLYLAAQKRKRIEDLRAEVRFGSLGKQDIIEAVSSVFQKMGLPQDAAVVYVTGDKNVNAYAVSAGFGFLSKKMRQVILNRATLHSLDKEELRTVIAHELAHIYRYPMTFYRAALLRSLLVGLVGVAIWSRIPSAIVVIIILGVYQWVLNLVFGKYSRTIEYLCDDCGAEIGGIEPALRAEFRVSQHQRTLSRAYLVALEQKLQGAPISAKQLQQVIEDSMTFDPTSAEALEKEVNLRLQKKTAAANESFVQHFKSTVFNDSYEAIEQLEEELENLKAAEKVETVPLPTGPEFEPALSFRWFKELVSRLNQEPNKPLFAIPNDITDDDSSHPSPKKRIVYLWNTYCGA